MRRDRELSQRESSAERERGRERERERSEKHVEPELKLWEKRLEKCDSGWGCHSSQHHSAAFHCQNMFRKHVPFTLAL